MEIVIIKDSEAIFSVPCTNAYKKCLKENKGFYDPVKLLGKPHGNKKRS